MMAKLYYRKIRDKEAYPATGEPWVIGDVPTRWRAEVQAMLDGAVS